MRRTRAFTLVELLVVVGIIGLLISIVMPSLAAVRRAGKSTKCKHNLHVIGQAFESYFSRNADLFPVIARLPSEEKAAEEAGTLNREPYPAISKVLEKDLAVSNPGRDEIPMLEVFLCPADEVADDGQQSIGIRVGKRYWDTEGTSYEWNDFLNPDYDYLTDQWGPQRRRRPRGAALFQGWYESSLSRLEMLRDYENFHGPDHMKGAINCLYGDMHVGSY